MENVKSKNNMPFALTTGQMASLISLFSPLVDIFVERVAQRVKQLEDDKEPRYYSRKEVAELLHVSLPTLHAMCNAGALQPQKIGGRVLFSAQGVDEAIRRGVLHKGTWTKRN